MNTEATQLEKEQPTIEEKVYKMDADPIKVNISIFASSDKAQKVTHVLRKPTFVEEEAKERATPLIISDMGKVDGAEASSMTLDDEIANCRMYDKIALSVSGYALERGQKPTKEEIEITKTIATPEGEKSIKELIPPSHKSTAIAAMFPAEYAVDFGDEEFYFALGGGREWRIKQEIGGKHKQEDGSLSPADYEVFYIFREPTQEERKKFRTQAISALTLRTTSGNKDRRSTNLRVINDLFNSLIQNIEGATINGGPIDVRDKKQLELIPAAFKKGTLIRLMNFLEADLSD